ncbi:MAG: response regulator receiver protein [Segetibacter sp.]|jgi:CheY-like chemotaxis protein|nr:response regulator receiver protein [Segetibacter sp.]
MHSLVKHIVIADDDDDDVDLFRTAVEEICLQLTLTVASDGVKLISLLDSIAKPDAIFLDLNMPRKSGKECLVEIRTKDEFNDVPIIMFSTSNQTNDIDFCLKNGANHYLVKPETYEGLTGIVENLCNGYFLNPIHTKGSIKNNHIPR